MKREDMAFLNQLLTSLEEAESKLEKSYHKKSYEEFNKSKKIIVEMQKKILEVIK